MPGVIEAVTSAAGQALNVMGGVRLTRLAQAAAVGDTALVVERSLGLPDTGLVQVGGVSYRYGKLVDGALLDLSVVTPQGTFDNVQVPHPRSAVVVDATRSYSALDLIYRGLFVDTATGEDLSILGRLLGVPRLADVADDDVYRGLIKAIAYGPRPTRLGLTAALDALVGPGHYLLTEDPGEPGVVHVVLDGSQLLSDTAIGKFFLTNVRPGALKAGNITVPGPLLHVTSLVAADCVFSLQATGQPFETQVASDGAGGTYEPLTLSAPGAFVPSTVFTNVPAYQNSSAGFLYAAGPVDASYDADLSAQVVAKASNLSVSDGRRFAIQLASSDQSVTLGLYAVGSNIGVALAGADGSAKTAMLATFASGTAADVRLQWSLSQNTARVFAAGICVYDGADFAQASFAPQGARWGCFGTQAGLVSVTRLSASLRSTQDLGVQQVTGLETESITISPQSTPPAGISRFAVRGDEVLGGQLLDNVGAINHRLSDGPPPEYLLWPAYLNEPTHLALSYLQNMVALGVQVRVSQGLGDMPS